MMEKQPLLFHLMLKQGFNWFNLMQEVQEAEEIWNKLRKENMYISEAWQEKSAPSVTLSLGPYGQDFQWIH